MSQEVMVHVLGSVYVGLAGGLLSTAAWLIAPPGRRRAYQWAALCVGVAVILFWKGLQ